MKKFALLILLFLLIGGGYYYYTEQSYSSSLLVTMGESMKGPRDFQIEKGSSLKNISEKLFAQKFIVDAGSFSRYTKEQHAENKITAGDFTLEGPLNIPQVLDILTGKVAPARLNVRILEGQTMQDLKNTLIKKNLTTEEEFAACVKNLCELEKDFPFLSGAASLEGYIFPDTYFIDKKSFTLSGFIKQALKNYEKRVVVGLSKEIDKTKRTLHEITIMASIIEKESRPRDDQSIVSGILWKRLDNNVQLAVDATNRYIKKDPLAPLTRVELQSNSPYNTRKIKGLPPTAISNPGLASIKAALTPKDSSFWYYLHDSSGIIHYSSTENEHNKAKALYIE